MMFWPLREGSRGKGREKEERKEGSWSGSGENDDEPGRRGAAWGLKSKAKPRRRKTPLPPPLQKLWIIHGEFNAEMDKPGALSKGLIMYVEISYLGLSYPHTYRHKT